MKINTLRLLILCWFILGALTVVGPFVGLGGWKDWPPEAVAYAQWAEYKIDSNPLPFKYQASLAGLIISVIAILLIFFRSSYGKFILLIGLGLHFYSTQSNIPAIASHAELTLDSVFYILTGAVLGISFSCKPSAEK